MRVGEPPVGSVRRQCAPTLRNRPCPFARTLKVSGRSVNDKMKASAGCLNRLMVGARQHALRKDDLSSSPRTCA